MWEYKIGTVVKYNGPFPSLDKGFGHITGFAESTTGETILEVKWQTGKTSIVHPSNVETE